MKNYSSEKLRTIAVIGHGSVGKTSLCDALYFVGGGTERLGSVNNDTSHFDHSPESRERKHSLASSIGIIECNNHKINLIDTPGLADFYGDTIGSLAVADGAVLILDGTDGVQVGSLKTWTYALKYNLPLIIWVNRVDREGADFNRAISDAQKSLNKSVIPFVFPIINNGRFAGLIDVLAEKAIDSSGKDISVPADFQDELQTYRMQIMEAAAETDDELLEKYFETETLSQSEIETGIQKAIVSRSIFPAFCGHSVPPAGQQFLLNALVAYMPSPLERSPETALEGDSETEVKPDSTGKFCARTFSTKADAHMGEIIFIRVLRGSINGTTDIVNTSVNSSERLGNYYLINGANRIDTDSLSTGDIAAVAKLKSTHTNDTLAAKGSKLVLTPISFPEPVYRVAIATKKRGDEEKMGGTLSRISSQDPTFIFKNEAEIGQTTVSGMGELHLNVILGRLKNQTGVETETFKPRIAYHETISKTASGSYKHKKQSGGRGQYGHVFIRLEPLPRGDGFEFNSEVVGGNVPTNFIPAVEKGVIEAMKSGPISKSKVVDLKAVVYDGSFHPVDSSDMAFKIASVKCFKDVMMNAGPSLLEPIVMLEVMVPDEFMGDVMGDLNTRRGRIQGIEAEGTFQVIKASVPESELFQYSSTLKSISQARGSFTQTFIGYEPVPKDIREKVMAEVQSDEEE